MKLVASGRIHPVPYNPRRQHGAWDELIRLADMSHEMCRALARKDATNTSFCLGVAKLNKLRGNPLAVTFCNDLPDGQDAGRAAAAGQVVSTRIHCNFWPNFWDPPYLKATAKAPEKMALKGIIIRIFQAAILRCFCYYIWAHLRLALFPYSFEFSRILHLTQ